MREQGSLRTTRLVLRPFEASDAPALSRLAGAREIADTTISIPHPYRTDQAAAFIAAHRAQWRSGTAVHFAVADPVGDELLGAVELRDIDREHEQAEISFWVAAPRWGRGYAPEAVCAVIEYGFSALALNRIYAHHMVRNPASGRVLEKLGFLQEGVLRQRVRKWGVYEDVVIRALLRCDWSSRPTQR